MTGLSIGFPCKTLSSQNSDPKSFKDVTSSTGGGFRALLDYCDYNPNLEWILTEMVRNITHQRKKFGNEIPIDIQNEELRKRGFVPIHSLISTADFGIPQSRTRCYGLYIKATCLKNRGPDPGYLFAQLKCKHMPTSKILNEKLSGCPKTTMRKSSKNKWQEDFKLMQKKYGKALPCSKKQKTLFSNIIISVN